MAPFHARHSLARVSYAESCFSLVLEESERLSLLEADLTRAIEVNAGLGHLLLRSRQAMQQVLSALKTCANNEAWEGVLQPQTLVLEAALAEIQRGFPCSGIPTVDTAAAAAIVAAAGAPTHSAPPAAAAALPQVAPAQPATAASALAPAAPASAPTPAAPDAAAPGATASGILAAGPPPAPDAAPLLPNASSSLCNTVVIHEGGPEPDSSPWMRSGEDDNSNHHLSCYSTPRSQLPHAGLDSVEDAAEAAPPPGNQQQQQVEPTGADAAELVRGCSSHSSNANSVAIGVGALDDHAGEVRAATRGSVAASSSGGSNPGVCSSNPSQLEARGSTCSSRGPIIAHGMAAAAVCPSHAVAVAASTTADGGSECEARLQLLHSLSCSTDLPHRICTSDCGRPASGSQFTPVRGPSSARDGVQGQSPRPVDVQAARRAPISASAAGAGVGRAAVPAIQAQIARSVAGEDAHKSPAAVAEAWRLVAGTRPVAPLPPLQARPQQPPKHKGGVWGSVLSLLRAQTELRNEVRGGGMARDGSLRGHPLPTSPSWGVASMQSSFHGGP